MSEATHLRLPIDSEVRQEFKAACMLAGTTMTEQMARMVTQFVSGNDPENEKGAPAGDARDASPTIVVSEVPVARTDPLAAMLDEKLGPINLAVASVATRENLDWLLGQLVKESQVRNDAIAQALAQTVKIVNERVEASHLRWQQVIAQNRRDRYWLGGAVLAGMTALGLLLALASGTSVGRSLAVKLTGGESRWHAALLLAGDGSMLQSDMIAETHAMLANQAFRDRYVQCVGLAMVAKSAVKCTLSMPPLNRAR